MRNFILFIGILFFVSCAGDKATKTQEMSAVRDYGSYKIKRGTNIAHWLSQSDKRGEERANFFTEKDIQYIASVGFDHIRLPVDEQQLWDSTGRREDAAF